MSAPLDPSAGRAIRERGHALAVSGLFQSWVQIGAEMEREGFKNAIRLIRDDEDLTVILNHHCNQSRLKSH